MNRPAKIAVSIAAGVVIALLIAVGSFLLYLRSPRFQRYVLTRITTEIENATGGRVELHGYQFRLRALQAELEGLTIHGLERDPARPLFAADTVFVQLKIISLFKRQVDFRLLRILHPRINVLVDAAGHSNVPEPKVRRAEGKGPLDKIWDLAIKRLEVINGQLNYNDRQIPLDFAADDVQAALTYDTVRNFYNGHLSLAAQAPSYGPLARIGLARFGLAEQGKQPGLPSRLQADLKLTPTTLEVTGLTWTTAGSELQANGYLFNFVQPKIVLNYKARLEGREFAVAAGLPELRAGEARLAGTLNYDTATKALQVSGDLRAERLSIALPELYLTGVYGSAKFQGTERVLEVPSFRLFLLGGELAGSARAQNPGRGGVITISTGIRGFSVSQLARTFSTRSLPLDQLHWAGTVSGHANIRYTTAQPGSAGGLARKSRGTGGRAGSPALPGPGDLRVESALNVEPPTVTPPGFVPVSGHADVVYAPAANQLDVHNLLLQTPGTRLTADGALGAGRRAGEPDSGEANLRVAASLTKLAEWTPFVAALRPGRPPIPLELAGRAEFGGTVRGTLRSPAIEGQLLAFNFRYGGAQWDRFSGNIAYSPQLLRVTQAQLQRGASSARFDATANLVEGEFSDASPFSLEAVVERARLADLQALAGASYPVTGLLDASIRATGTRLNPQGSGFAQVTNGAIEGQPFDSLRANLNFGQHEVHASGIVLRKGASQITGEAEYRLTDRSYRFQLAGSRISLGEVTALASSQITLSGLAGFRASGTGTLERPSFDASLQISNLLVNGEQVGNLTANVEARDGVLTAKLQSRLLKGNVSATATADLRGDYPARGRVEFSNVDLDPLLGNAIRSRISAHNVASGFVTFAAPLKKPEALTANAEIADFHIALGQADLRNVGPVLASYRNGLISIHEAHLAGTETDLRVSGSVRVNGPPAARFISLQADGAANLALVKAINTDLVGSGQVILHANAGGTLGRPVFNGRAEFRNAGLAVQDFPIGLSNMQGALLFDTSRLRIESLTAQVGGGNLQLTGYIGYASIPPVFALQAQAENVRVRYPQGVSSVLDGKLRLTGTSQQGLLNGDITVSRVHFDPRLDLAAALGLVRTPISTPPTSPLLNNLQLNLRMNSSPNLQFQFSQARNIQMEANLRLRGTAARPVVLGRVNLTKGEITFVGTRYNINRGDINFTNPVRTQPDLSLSLETRVQEYDIAIDLNGPLDKLSVNYRSDPPLPSNEVQALLISGRPPGLSTAAPVSQTMPELGANTILSQALNMAVGSRIERIFGVSNLKIDPQVGGPETNPGARITLEQQVTPDLRFTYITNLSSSQQQVIQVEWSINENWSVVAVRDRNGLFGMDLKWRKRFH